MASKQKLGRLENVLLTEAWESEARDFTPWLAQKENLSLLGQTLNLDLELEDQEKRVGLFRADILCKDTVNGNWVLIENQIERTDHTHLGQIITYAAGLKAVTIVWIAKNFTEEHRAALDWLNQMTAENINFFGLEIELWKIGESPCAPKFNIVSQPNNWSETVKRVTNENLTDIKQLQLEFWTDLYQFLHEKDSIVRPQKPAAQHWMYMAIGRSNFLLSATLHCKEERLSVALVIQGPYKKEFFKQLFTDKVAIEKEFGEPFEWRELPDKKESHIVTKKLNSDLKDVSRWPEYEEWMYKTLVQFHKVFNQRIKNLKNQ
jgi:hypothetical protein